MISILGMLGGTVVFKHSDQFLVSTHLANISNKTTCLTQKTHLCARQSQSTIEDKSQSIDHNMVAIASITYHWELCLHEDYHPRQSPTGHTVQGIPSRAYHPGHTIQGIPFRAYHLATFLERTVTL